MTRLRFMNSGRGILLALSATLLLLGSHGCALFFKAPAVRIVGVEVVSLGMTSGTAEVELEVRNQGRSEMRIRGFLYEIDVAGPEDNGGWNQLAEGFHDESVNIFGGEAATVRVPVPFEYAALGDAIRRILSSGDLPYRLKGEVWMGGANLGLQIPFRSEGTIRP